MSLTSYNTLATARATATSLGLARVAAASDAALTAALMLAAIDIDSPGFRFQGHKYVSTQAREFPRAGDAGLAFIWDWDSTAEAAIVPDAVKTAEAIQAESILAGDRNQIVQAYANGIASQATGSVSVSFRGSAGPQPLCERAMRMMSRYRLRGGALL